MPEDADAILSRWMHRVSSLPLEDSQRDARQWEELVARYLPRALRLRSWFEAADRAQSYARRFDLGRSFNRPESSYGFFDVLESEALSLPIMGNVQEMFYDHVRAPLDAVPATIPYLRRQLREFVLRYFMRVSDFRQPDTYEFVGRTETPGALRVFSWCRSKPPERIGFGFSQICGKLADSGKIVFFPPGRIFSIVDLREVGPVYDWIVLRVRIFDFAFRFKVPVENGPELVLPLDEESYIAITRDFVRDETHADGSGRYGLGYAFLRSPERGLLAYGPGQFEAAWEQIDFLFAPTGAVRVRMVFVVDRPAQILNVDLNPIRWAARIGRYLSAGWAGDPLKLAEPLARTADSLPLTSFDPVSIFITTANLLTAGWAAEDLCISRDQLDRDFLITHFEQHYQAVSGSLLTWRQIADWTNEQSLPDWVVNGVSS